MLYRLAVLGLFLSCLGSSGSAQDDVDALRKRVAELEAENRKLRGLVGILGYAQKVENGVVVNPRIGDGRTARLVVARDGWGDAKAEDVAAVCVSCAQTIFDAIKPDKGKEPTIFVIRDPQGPMALSQRGPGGEFIVLLNAGDRHWSQVAYQFSHELGHVLCGELIANTPQLWFEEAFCESLSLWTMDKMAVSWQTAPPYPNWKDYAPSLASYTNDVRNRVTDPPALSDWYRSERDYFTRKADDRNKNLVLAKTMAAQAHMKPEFYQAFYYLRRGTEPKTNTMEWLLANWYANCPVNLQFVPAQIADQLQLIPRK